MIAAFFSKIWGWLAVLGGLIAAGLAAYFAGRSVGKSKQSEVDNEATAVRQVNEARAASDTRVEATKNAKDQSDAVNQLDTSAIADELRTNWTRDETAAYDNASGADKAGRN